MKRVRDRERKCLSRKTPAGQFKRRLEYQARRDARAAQRKTLAGDARGNSAMRVEGRIEQEHVKGEKRKREKAGIGTEDEDLGEEGDDTGAVDLPKDMVEPLRVDLSVWKATSIHPKK